MIILRALLRLFYASIHIGLAIAFAGFVAVSLTEALNDSPGKYGSSLTLSAASGMMSISLVLNFFRDAVLGLRTYWSYVRTAAAATLWPETFKLACALLGIAIPVSAAQTLEPPPAKAQPVFVMLSPAKSLVHDQLAIAPLFRFGPARCKLGRIVEGMDLQQGQLDAAKEALKALRACADASTAGSVQIRVVGFASPSALRGWNCPSGDQDDLNVQVANLRSKAAFSALKGAKDALGIGDELVIEEPAMWTSLSEMATARDTAVREFGADAKGADALQRTAVVEVVRSGLCDVVSAQGGDHAVTILKETSRT